METNKTKETGETARVEVTNPPAAEDLRSEIARVDIPDAVTDEVIEAGDDATMWAKATEAGFAFNDKTVPTLTGVITAMYPYLVKWEEGQPHKIANVANDIDIPEGYERRCDVKMEVGAGQLVGVSLSKSSFKYHLSPYVRHLKGVGLRAGDVVTRLRVLQVSNRMGTFNVVAFEVVDDPGEEAIAGTVDSGTPSPAAQDSNPWT